MDNNNPAGRCGGPGKLGRSIVGVLLVLLTGAVLVMAWTGWQRDRERFGQMASVAEHRLCAVTLTSGQVYYGTVVQLKDGYIRLENVYYVQSMSQSNGGPAQFRVTSRKKTDWHGPDWMVIPADKIEFVENVGAQSRLASLIAQDRGAAAAQ